MSKPNKAFRHRHLIQIGFTFLTNLNLKGFLNGTIYGGQTKNLCVPGLNCYSCPGAMGSCPIGAMQGVSGSIFYSISFYVIGFLIVVGSFIGRLVCGFLCPMGLVQDLLYKIPFPKKLGRLPGDKILKYLPYVVLAVFVIIIPTFITGVGGIGSPAFCKYICPSGTLMAGWPLAILNKNIGEVIGSLFAFKSIILVVIIILSIISYRPFCRYLCPLGAIYGLFNPISVFGINFDENKCTFCMKCKGACKWSIDVPKKPNSRECIRCGDCIKACPEDALSYGMRKNPKEKTCSNADLNM